MISAFRLNNNKIWCGASAIEQRSRSRMRNMKIHIFNSIPIRSDCAIYVRKISQNTVCADAWKSSFFWYLYTLWSIFISAEEVKKNFKGFIIQFQDFQRVNF